MADPKKTSKIISSKRDVASSRRRSEDLSDYVFGKVPPQSPALEEAVLGAIMLDRNAFSTVLEILRAESFYIDAHQMIYKAMQRLFERSQPIDLLTVMEELKKSGELEMVGGPAYLATLTNKVASAANIEHHARIIAQKYMQRELIRVSTGIIRDAFEDTTDVFDLLDGAEQGLYGIIQQNMSHSYEAIGTLASKAFKQLQALQNKPDGLTGVPTGFAALDRLTSGWQPSDLIIIAARPGMGKTSFVLSIARNAALDYQKAVAIFSLEMSNVQLAQRLISMEAEVSSSKLRTGKLEKDEMERLVRAIDRIGDAPIYIDDTPSINIFELRAKCRRMKAHHNIQLIIIDYLQLMSGGGESQRGNREQEVSAISRALKGLAKELNVPVIALSQLSRAVEVRGGTKRPQLSDLRESGCLTGDTLIQDAISGQRIPIKALLEKENTLNFQVLATDACGKIRPHPLAKAFYSGQKPVFELKTRSGRRIKASANHPFLKLEGWTALENLTVGDRIAAPRAIEIAKPQNPLSDDEIILLAHLIGGGCILPRQPYHYTSTDDANIAVVNHAVKTLFGIQPRVVQQENWRHIYLPSPYRLTHGRRHPITRWYKNLGLERVRSYEKSLPAAIFECDNAKISLFLHHLWATDGNISWKELPGKKRAGSIYYATSSLRLAEQVQHLLLRLGIISTLGVSKQKGGKYQHNCHIRIQGVDNQLLFLKKVGCFGARGCIISELIPALEAIESNSNNGVLHKEGWNLLVYPAMQQQKLSYRKVFDKLGLTYAGFIKERGISKFRLQKLNHAIGDSDSEKLIESDLFWDEIVAITPLGVEDVYDLTVPEVHNFVANDLLVHNSIEQDADIVSFIYRPEYYGIHETLEGESTKGIAEIIVAKHRNGAQGDIKLRFKSELAQFTDLDNFDFSHFPADAFQPDTGSGVITIPSRMNEDEDIPF